MKRYSEGWFYRAIMPVKQILMFVSRDTFALPQKNNFNVFAKALSMASDLFCTLFLFRASLLIHGHAS
jgi:hypothetical protein